ncbi:MAG: PBP1A family penicillin-binding protein [Acidobacteria bacterium]|nr:PBP1A family penicillin-binding protein [Acidobacteriota bacterium]
MPPAMSPPRALVHPARPRRRLRWFLAIGLGVPFLILLVVTGYYYVSFSRVIDERLHGERLRTLPRVLARPFEIRRGQWLSSEQFVDRLNVLGYAERPRAEQPGEFSRGDNALTMVPKGGDHPGQILRITFNPRGGGLVGPVGEDGRPTPMPAIERLELSGAGPVDEIRLESPLLTALITANREKRRRVSLSLIPRMMVQAVLAIEDRRFYEHPGIDPIRIAGAIITNIRGDKPYLVGGSTLTQQLVKNFFLTPEKSLRRKFQEQFLAIVLETRASKDEILELYLNEVYLGQRGSFAIHGVAEASRLFFGKDVTNLSLAEAATIAGVIQAPYTHSPFSSATRSRDRRNVVLQAMVDSGYVTQAAAERAGREPLQTIAHALDTEAPYFVDLLGETLADQYPGLLSSSQPVDIFTTLDTNLQRLAQEAVQGGIVQIDEQLAKRRVKGRAQVALIAIDPRTGDVLAYVGGRSYSQSQFNRAVNAKRQPGSVFKPFVYLAAFEAAAATGRTDLTPATVVDDEQTTFTFEDKDWTPGNYEDEYDGMITLRRALALSRNVATVKVAEMIGFGKVADLWKRFGSSTAPRPYPSIALGVFEATPFEIASAYTVFPNYGELRPLRPIERIVNGGIDVRVQSPAVKRVARRDTTFLVTNMMRSVLNEGTAASARSLGFALDAAGKTGTTNDLRDAWFVGFTPGLLTAVWVGFDDNQPLGLSGAVAALPIWTRFMMAALAGRPAQSFQPPEGIVFVDIDRDTGKLAQPACPRLFREAFVAGTEPTEACDLHRF